MRLITNNEIKNLGISPSKCIDWVKESFSLKNQSILPPKTKISQNSCDFFTSMPCLLPLDRHMYGIKIVHRIEGVIPALGSDILLYDTITGALLALLEGAWITAMRTGAVAALAAKTFRINKAHLQYGIIGLGNTARATLLCLLDSEPEIEHNVILFKYKNQEKEFIKRFAKFPNVRFVMTDNIDDLIRSSDVLFSCITVANGILCKEDKLFKPGCTIIPVHTRGFQNCDLTFDKVYGDDTDHIKEFQYFDKFKFFAELGNVLDGTARGRDSSEERILSYNVGIGLHDVLFADKIYNLIGNAGMNVNIQREQNKYWI